MDIRRSGKPSENNEKGSNGDSSKKQQDSGSTQAGSSAGSGDGIMGPMLMILVLIILAVVGIYVLGGDSNTSSNSPANGPVARVGDQTIAAQEFNRQLSSLREATTSRAQQFQSLSDTRQKELVLSGLINQALLRQAALNAGVSVSDSEVQSRLQSQIKQIGGESEFKKRLSQNNLTRQQVRENLRQQMLISAYVQQAATTTDQQVQQLYNQYRSQLSQSQAGTSSQSIPSLEQLRPQLEATIQQRNRQQLLQQARNNINVEVLLEGVDYPPSSQQQTQPSGQSNQQQTQQETATQTPATDGTGTGQTQAATGSPAQ